MFRAFRPAYALLGIQLLGACVLLALLVVAPPARGNLLLVPTTMEARSDMVAIALAHGALLVQRGPLPASVIVSGDRKDLFVPLARHGVLILAGGIAGCAPISSDAV